MKNNKITPCLWFHAEGGKVSHVIEYYQKIFGEHFEAGSIIPLGETPSGNAEMCDITFFNEHCQVMCTENKHHAFNDAFAFMIDCKDQGEIDTYWNYFTKEGEESQCGWCRDRFGLRWQIIPENFGELMSKSNSWEIMMKQKKIVIQDYLQ